MSSTEDPVELTSVVQHPDGLETEQSEPESQSEEALSVTPQTTKRAKLASKLKTLIIGKDTEGKTELKRELTVLSGVAFVTGNLIGSGIFITPRTIFDNTGSFGVSMILWGIGAFIALAGGLCYIELGLVVKKSGGEYPILLTAYSFKKRNKFVVMFGQVLSFVYIWSSLLIVRSVGASIMMLTCARYMSRPFYPDCEVPRAVVTTLALSVLLVVATVNSISIKFTARVVTLLSALKIISLLFITLVGVGYLIANNGFPMDSQQPFYSYPGHEPTSASIALALYGVTFAYDGWNVMNYAIEETKNVEKTLPRSLFIGIPIVAVCYLSVNLAFFGVLCYDQILKADAVALEFGHTALGEAGLVLIPLLVALSTFGSALATIYTASRLVFAAARDGLLPQAFSGLHKTYKTPIPAIIFQVVIVSIGIAIGDISSLLTGYSAVVFTFYALVFIALIILRITHREAPRPFKLWFILPVTLFSILVSILLVVLPLQRSPVPSVVSFGLTLCGLLVYPVFIANTPWKRHLTAASESFARFTKGLFNTEITQD